MISTVLSGSLYTLTSLLSAVSGQADTEFVRLGGDDLTWVDIDADGRLELLVRTTSGVRLLRQEGVQMIDVSEAAGLVPGETSPLLVSVIAPCDIEGDGDIDLFLGSTTEGVRLLVQEDGTFTDTTSTSALSQVSAVEEARWLDLDGDRHIDLELQAFGETRLFLGSSDGFLELGLDALPARPVPAASSVPAAEDRREAAPEPGSVSASRSTAGGRSASSVVGAGGSPSMTGGPGPIVNPMGSLLCADHIADQSGGACLAASRIPALDTLYPLSVDFNVDPATGRVGMGTTSPAAALEVVGQLLSGINNTIGGSFASVGGGENNDATGMRSTIAGGWRNEVSGEGATVPGGLVNKATGYASFAAGSGASALHDGTFVWSDSDQNFESTGTDQFLVRASGGTGIGTNAPMGTLHVLGEATKKGLDTRLHVQAGVDGEDSSLILQENDVHGVRLRSDGASDTFDIVDWESDVTRMSIHRDSGIVSVGGLAPASGAFKLTVDGRVRSTSGGFEFPDGSIQTNAATGTPWEEDGTNIYFPSGGNVGIGGTAPLAPLHVIAGGNGLLDNNNDHIVVDASDAGIGIFSDAGGSFGSKLGFYEVANGAIRNYWRMIRRTGNASSDQNHLRWSFEDVEGSTSTVAMEMTPGGGVVIGEGGLKFNDGSTQTTGTPWEEDGTNIYFPSGGNVGIGGTAPLAPLHVIAGGNGLLDNNNDHIVVDASDAGIGIFSDAGGSFGSKLGFYEVSNGTIQNSWKAIRRTSNSSSNQNHLQWSFYDGTTSTVAMEMQPGGGVVIGEGGLKFNDGSTQTSAAIGTPWGGDGTDIYFSSGGNVGIGGTAPLAPLHVIAGGNGLPHSNNDHLVVDASDAGIGIFSDSGGSSGSKLGFYEVANGAIRNYWRMIRRTGNASPDQNHLLWSFEDVEGSTSTIAMEMTPEGQVIVPGLDSGTASVLGGGVATQASTGIPALRAENPNGGSAIYAVSTPAGAFGEDGTTMILETTSTAPLIDGTVDGTMKFQVKNTGGLRLGVDSNDDAFLQANAPAGEDPFRIKLNGNPRLGVNDDGGVVVGSNVVGSNLDSKGTLHVRGGATNGVDSALYVENPDNGNAIIAVSNGGDTTMILNTSGTGSLIKARVNNIDKFQVTNTGRVITSAVEITGGGDLVEGFESSGDVRPGTVVSIDAQTPGALLPSAEAYDSKVAGVVSGAGGVNHGIRMGQAGALDGDTLLAMAGRVWTRCSAENGAIRPGDRLTTANLAGHAMKATDAARSSGTVIGKAMSGLDEGTGLVLVLINLQ